MNISDAIKGRKINDKKEYDRAIRAMYDAVEGKEKQIFSSYENNGIESELNLILKYFRIGEQRVPEEVPEENRIDYILDSANIMRRNIHLKDQWWKNDSIPLFCRMKKDGKYHALIPGKMGGLYYYDAEKGKQVRVNKRTEELFERDATCFYLPMPEKEMDVKSLILFLMKALSPTDYIFVTVISLIVTLMGLLLPYVNQYIFQFTIPSGQKDDIYFVSVFLLGVVVSTALFELFREIWIARVGDKVKNTAEIGLWNRILNLPSQFFKQADAGEITGRAMMLGELCDMIVRSVIPVLLTTVFSSVYIIQITTFSPKLLPPVLLILFLMLAYSCLTSFLMIRQNQRENKVSMMLSGLAFQLFEAVGTLKVNGAEIRAFSQWSDVYGEKIKIRPNFFVKYADSFNTILQIGGSILIFSVVYSNDISASMFVSFQVAFGFLTGILGWVSGIVTQLAYVKPAVQMILPFLQEKPEKNSQKMRVVKLDGKIDINNLCFRYSPDMGDVLHNLSLSIAPGEYVALVGSSGCGKSTLFRILLGFEKPDRGAVYYDDMDLNELDYQSVRRCIGTVLQDGSLFAGDLYSNITLCAPEMSMEEAWEIAEQAGCAEDIRNMPMGMFTMVSDGSGGISGGQKQRILIARALAMNPDIMLFDEATSALDNVTQKRVVESLAQRNVTRVVIAHRLSTIKECDRILYLDKGSVAEEGTYEELMAKKGKFYELAKYQLVK